MVNNIFELLQGPSLIPKLLACYYFPSGVLGGKGLWCSTGDECGAMRGVFQSVKNEKFWFGADPGLLVEW